MKIIRLLTKTTIRATLVVLCVAVLSSVDALALGMDTDGDGVKDERDNCPFTSNPDQRDADGFGLEQSISTPPAVEYAVAGVVAMDVDVDQDLDAVWAEQFQIRWAENLDGLGSFGPPQFVANVNHGRSLIPTDLDGDTDIDLLYFSDSNGSIYWSENLGGSGGFKGHGIVSIGSPTSVFAADLDGDLNIDVLSTSDGNHTVAWYRNLGGGVFGPQQIITNSGTFPHSVFAADLDGDQDLDVICGSLRLTWYENLNGAGTFGPAQLITEDVYFAHVFAADLDGDLDVDVVAASRADVTNAPALAWYENLSGLGGFGAQQVIEGSPYAGESVSAADMDGDSDLDLLSVFDPHPLAWYENADGAGSFAIRHVLAEPTELTSAVAADIDGDGHLDAVASFEFSVSWFENLADGVGDACDNCPGLPNATQLDDDRDEFGDACDTCPRDFDPQQVDADGDHVGDVCDNCLVLSNPGQYDPDSDGVGSTCDNCSADANASQIDGDADGSGDACDNCPAVANPEQIDTNDNGIGDVCDECRDEDRDGACFVDNCPGVSNPSQADADGDFGVPQTIDTLSSGNSAVAADLDGDFDRDVLVATGGGSFKIAWYENLGGPAQFGPRQVIASSDVVGTVSVCAADVDGDSDKDVVAAAGNDVLWFENLNGAETFGSPNVVAQFPDDTARSIFCVDLDDDGDVDVLSSFIDRMFWFENLHSGIFGPERLISAAVGATSLFAADVDGDADPDVLAASSTSFSQVVWFENLNGAGTFGPVQTISAQAAQAAQGAQGLFVADVDGDSDRDVVIAANEIAWHENLDGEGSFGPKQVITTAASNARSVFVADLDRDADLDVLSAAQNNVAWYENVDGAGSFGPRQLLALATNGRFAVAAEFDGTADVDVLVVESSRISWFGGSSDGLGDACDNCPVGDNVDQADADGDNVGDFCDVCGLDPDNDTDQDGSCGDVDLCSLNTNWAVLDEVTASDGQSGDRFGTSVALSAEGALALVGAFVGNGGLGSAYVLERSGAAWTQQAELVAADAGLFDLFGWSVALSADGSAALVAAQADDLPSAANAGSAYVFARSGAVWVQESKLTALDSQADANFGRAVSLSADGTMALVGAPWHNLSGVLLDAGAGYVFVKNGATWTQQARLTATPAATGDQLGSAVALSADGTRALVGAPLHNLPSAVDAGAAYVFVKNGATWTQQAKLTATGPAAGDQFGSAVALSADGRVALVGAPFGREVFDSIPGAAYVFVESGGIWTQQSQLLIPQGRDQDQFGNSVALSGEGTTALVGARSAETTSGPADTGLSYLFVKHGGQWTRQGILSPQNGQPGDASGNSVALTPDGTLALVGAFEDDPAGAFEAGSASFFTLSVDVDSDGVGDVCDNCPDVANPDQHDTDGDEIGDACSGCTLQTFYEDDDGDGFGSGDATHACAPPPGYSALGGDCDDAESSVWAVPGNVQELEFVSKTTLAFDAPAEPAGLAGTTRYDTIRSQVPWDFGPAWAVCVETDGTDLLAEDAQAPAPGTIFHYLVRAENDCGAGTIGTGTSGARPPAIDCE